MHISTLDVSMQSFCSKGQEAHDRLLLLSDLCVVTTYSRSSIYRLMKVAGFPQPIKLGGPNGRSVWLASEVYAWLASRIHVRDSKTTG